MCDSDKEKRDQYRENNNHQQSLDITTDCSEITTVVTNQLEITINQSEGTINKQHPIMSATDAPNLTDIEMDILQLSDLEKACFTNDTHLLSDLISSGVNINDHNQIGVTPLMIAVYRGHAHCVDSLLTHNAEVVQGSSILLSRLHLTCLTGDRETLILLAHNEDDSNYKVV